MDRHCWLYTAWIRADLSQVSDGRKAAGLADSARATWAAKAPAPEGGRYNSKDKPKSTAKTCSAVALLHSFLKQSRFLCEFRITAQETPG